MSRSTGAGCRIMRCAYFVDSGCAYAGTHCRFNAERDDEGRPSIKLHDLVNAGMESMHGEFAIKLKLALDALGEISEACRYNEVYEEYTGAETMRNIADSALRRISLNRPD